MLRDSSAESASSLGAAVGVPDHREFSVNTQTQRGTGHGQLPPVNQQELRRKTRTHVYPYTYLWFYTTFSCIAQYSYLVYHKIFPSARPVQYTPGATLNCARTYSLTLCFTLQHRAVQYVVQDTYLRIISICCLCTSYIYAAVLTEILLIGTREYLPAVITVRTRFTGNQ